MDTNNKTIFEKAFKLIEEVLIPLAHQNYPREPKIILKPFHEDKDYMFLSMEIKYSYFVDLQDLSSTLEEYGFLLGSIDPVDDERISIEIQQNHEERSTSN